MFASANTKLPDELYDEGLVEKPVTFAGNRLVLAVPASSDAEIASLQDIERAGTTLAIGSESVPVGSYTRTVLSKLPESESSAILEERPLGGARRGGHRRQAHAGRGRRRLRLRLRRARDRTAS